MTEKDSDFAFRLAVARKERGLTQDGLADRSGVSVRSIARYENGYTEPGHAALRSLAKALGVNQAWLGTGKGKMTREISAGLVEEPVETWDAKINPGSPVRDSAIVIPVYNVEAAAGPGFINDVEAIHSKFPFERSELVKRGISPAQAAAIYVSGDSMKGSLEPGEIIFFAHQTDMRVISGSIYIIRMGDTVMVKRLVGKTPSLLIAMSDNKNYEPLEINLKDEWLDFNIIGRVFASIKWH